VFEITKPPRKRAQGKKMILSTAKTKCTTPAEAAGIVSEIISSYDANEQEKEHFFAIGLSNKNTVKYIDLVSIGTISETIVHPREVFRNAICRGASSILLVHNHPSGDIAPSAEDRATTQRLIGAGNIIGIGVIDHVIIGDGFYSFRENNMI
jgi:DNA repair protein RadC